MQLLDAAYLSNHLLQFIVVKSVCCEFVKHCCCSGGICHFKSLRAPLINRTYSRPSRLDQ